MMLSSETFVQLLPTGKIAVTMLEQYNHLVVFAQGDSALYHPYS